MCNGVYTTITSRFSIIFEIVVAGKIASVQLPDIETFVSCFAPHPTNPINFLDYRKSVLEIIEKDRQTELFNQICFRLEPFRPLTVDQFKEMIHVVDDKTFQFSVEFKDGHIWGEVTDRKKDEFIYVKELMCEDFNNFLIACDLPKVNTKLNSVTDVNRSRAVSKNSEKVQAVDKNEEEKPQDLNIEVE